MPPILLDLGRDKSDECHHERTPSQDGSERCNMQTFTIDQDDNITVFASAQEVNGLPEGTRKFANQRQLAILAEKWPISRLVEIWNSLAGVAPVKKFTDRTTAVARIWKAIQSLGPAAAPQPGTSRAKKARLAQKASGRKGGHPGSGNTKTAQVIGLLKQPGGASLKAIMRATGWQAHSVRGFISGHLGKKMGLRVKSLQREGERVYAIRG